MSIWEDQETQDGVEAVDPEKVVEEKEEVNQCRSVLVRERFLV